MKPQHETDTSDFIRRHADYHDAPADLHDRIVASLRAADAAAAPARRVPAPARWKPWFNLGAAFALGVVVSLTAAWFVAASREQDRIAQAFVSSHVRALMTAHLADVRSSDRHTVKPWFAGKLDFSPPVRDLAASGFPLAGGRVEYIDGRAAAALVYTRRQHVINVFVRPRADSGATPPRETMVQGYNVTGWDDGAMQYWLVSDLNAAELAAFARALRAGGEAPRPGS